VDERAQQFLDRRRVAHLATVSSAGAPHVVPVCFAVVGSTVYVAIDEQPKRFQDPLKLRRLLNIADNPQVALVADVYDDNDWSQLGFVLLRGVARVIVPGVEHLNAIATLRQKYVQYRDMALELRPVIAIDVQQVTVWGQLDG